MHSGSARAVNFVLKKQESDILKAKETLSQNLSRSSTNMLSKKLIFQSDRSSNAQGISFYIGQRQRLNGALILWDAF